MENILSVEETKTRLICELSTVTGFKYLKSGILKKTVKDIVFEINFFSSKWNASGQSIEVNADLRIIYKKYGIEALRNVYVSAYEKIDKESLNPVMRIFSQRLLWLFKLKVTTRINENGELEIMYYQLQDDKIQE